MGVDGFDQQRAAEALQAILDAPHRTFAQRFAFFNPLADRPGRERPVNDARRRRKIRTHRTAAGLADVVPATPITIVAPRLQRVLKYLFRTHPRAAFLT